MQSPLSSRAWKGKGAVSRLFFLSSAFLLSAPRCVPDGPPEGARFLDYDPLAYDYTFAIPEGTAQGVVTLEAREGGNCVSLDYRLQRIDALEFDGAPPTWFRLADEKLDLCGPEIAAEERFTVSGRFTVPPRTYEGTDVGYAVLEDAQGDPFYALIAWVEGCSFLGPCYDDPDDFAHYTFHVSHPADYEVRCPGAIEAGEGETTCTFTFEGGPTYSTFGFQAGRNWARVSLGEGGGISLFLEDIPGVDLGDRVDREHLWAFLDWITARLGPFPYGETLRFVTGPFFWWGFEHPGNIALAESLALPGGAYEDPLLHVMMHETVHQWGGDRTTLAATTDFVWKEAVAEYLTFVFEAEHLPPIYAEKTLTLWRSNAYQAGYYPVPTDESDPFAFYGDVYGTGPMILFRQLEVQLGRDTVLSAISRFLATSTFRSVRDLQEALEAEGGVDLSEYFDEWVYGAGRPIWPVVEVTYTDRDGDGTYAVEVTQVQNTTKVYGLRFLVRFRGSMGQTFDLPVDFGLDGRERSRHFEITPGFRVRDFDLDPDHEAIVRASGRPFKGAEGAFRPF